MVIRPAGGCQGRCQSLSARGSGDRAATRAGTAEAAGASKEKGPSLTVSEWRPFSFALLVAPSARHESPLTDGRPWMKVALLRIQESVRMSRLLNLFIQKPFSIEELAAKVHRALGRR